MFTEILKIKPKLDAGGLASMEKSLSQRFARVASRFGKGLKTALLGGGGIGIALGLINKLLNPLNDTVDTLKNLLNKGDDLVTSANQFNTTEGKLATLQALGQSTGLEDETVRQLLTKFQSAHAEASLGKDTDSANLVKEFAKEKDIVEAFASFMRSLQVADKDLKTFAENTVFGEKIVGKSSEFLNLDINKRLSEIKPPSEQQLTESARKVGELSDLKELNDAQRNLKDFVLSASVATPEMVKQLGKAADQEAAHQREQLARFEELQKAGIALDSIKNSLEKGFSELLKFVPEGVGYVKQAVEFLKPISDSIRKLSEKGFGWFK